jgi:hypothetical protein
MAQGLAHKTPISRGATLFAGGGGTHYHPFKFVDASTINPVAVKTAIATAQSSLYSALYPSISEQTITAMGGSGSRTAPIALTATTKIWLHGVVGANLALSSVEITTTGPSSDSERIKFNTANGPVQTDFWVLLAYVSAGANPTAPGYDFMITTTAYHLSQVCFTHLRTEIRVENGKPYIYAYPFVG